MTRRPRHKRPKTYAFIDSQNLNIGVQSHGWKIDWRKFRKFLAERYNVVNAYLFIGYLPENEDLYTQMHDAGYLVVLKPTIDMYLTPEEKAEMAKPAKEGEEPKKMQTKGNVDAELVLYAVKEMPNYDKAIIVSGDGDFFGLVEYLIQQDKLLHLMAPNRKYSSLLKPFEPYILRVDEFRRELTYRGYRGKKPAPKK
jgi:uncharacterized LabA/DUF88 family protein